MAGVKEMGLAIAGALASEHGPNPLPVSFKGESLSDAGAIVLAVLRECRDAGVKLARLEVDPDLFKEVQLGVDVPVQSSLELNGEARFWRS